MSADEGDIAKSEDDRSVESMNNRKGFQLGKKLRALSARVLLPSEKVDWSPSTKKKMLNPDTFNITGHHLPSNFPQKEAKEGASPKTSEHSKSVLYNKQPNHPHMCPPAVPMNMPFAKEYHHGHPCPEIPPGKMAAPEYTSNGQITFTVPPMPGYHHPTTP